MKAASESEGSGRKVRRGFEICITGESRMVE